MKIPHYPTAAAITKFRRRDELQKVCSEADISRADAEHLSRPRRSPPT
jgi:hypothetical protein